MKGLFNIHIAYKGVYQLRISYIEYEDVVLNNIQVFTAVTDLGKIALHTASNQLAEVRVNSRKRLIQNKGDKIIYNAGADIGNKSGNAADVLRKAPLVTVDPAGNVKLRGNSSIKVLLNGLPSGIMARNLKDALKLIPASTIVSVEIITNPSAKYEAEGAAGVINIITQKKVAGISGNLDVSAGNLERSIGGGINVSRGKFSIDASLTANREKQRNVWDMDRTSKEPGRVPNNLLQNTDATEISKGLYGDFSAEYRPDSSQTIGIGFSYWDGAFPSNSSFYNRFSENNRLVSEYNQNSEQQMKFGSFDLSANYNKKFKRPKQELQFISQFSHIFDNSTYRTSQSELSGANKFSEQGLNRSNNNDFSFQADYGHPLSKSGSTLLEIGAKLSDGKAKSTYQVFNNKAVPGGSTYVEDRDRSNVMNYTQQTLAAYVSLQLQTNNNWTFRPGVRFENTRMKGQFQTTTPMFTASFDNFVPSILILRKLNEQHTLKFNFAQRIRRPGIWELNPYVNASDPQNRTAGNPNLRPEITRTLELGHAFNAVSGFTLNSSIYFTRNDNAIEGLTIVNDSGISITSAQNIARIQRFGTNINVSLQPVSKMTINAGGELYVASFKSDALKVNNRGTFYNVNLNVSYQLPADYSFDFYGDYSNGDITLQGYNSNYYSYKFAVRKELLNKKAGLTLSFNNPFQRYLQQQNFIHAATFSSRQANRFYNQSVALSFNWQFGGMRPEKPEKDKQIETEKTMPHGKKKW